MQPNIFMWGGLLKSIIDSDLHIVLDIVKSSKNSRYNRNRIAGKGNPTWLTIPFNNFKREKKICDQELDTSQTKKDKLINFFKERYSEAKYYEKAIYILENTLLENKDLSNLCDVYHNFLNALDGIGLPLGKIEFASDLFDKKHELEELKGINLINRILKETNAETYLSSENTINYANPNEYNVSKIWIQKFSAKEYSQLDFNVPKKFEPNLSILDMISCLNTEEILINLNQSNYWNKISK